MSYKDLPRQSVLNDRHLALGSKLDAEWNGMPIPQSYNTDRYEETTVVRSRAGLFDVSGLRMVNVEGPDAESVLNVMLTSDVSKIKPGQSAISNIVDENGSLIDDVLVYRDGPQKFRVSHGGGSLEEVLAKFTEGRSVEAAKDNDVHILSLQGPLALDILKPHTPFDLPQVKPPRPNADALWSGLPTGCGHIHRRGTILSQRVQAASAVGGSGRRIGHSASVCAACRSAWRRRPSDRATNTSPRR